MLFKHLQNTDENNIIQEFFSDDHVFSENDIVNEAYYGKTKELKRCEELFKSLVKKLKNDELLMLNETKEAKQISKLLSSMFKIKSLELVFTTEHHYGAHTHMDFLEDSLKQTKKVFRIYQMLDW